VKPLDQRDSRRGAGFMRLRGLVRKEALQIVRDPSSIAIAFVLPLILLLLFGYGVSLDAQHVPIALVVETPSTQTASFAAFFAQSPYFRPLILSDFREAESALMRGAVDGVVWLRGNFGREILSSGASPIGVTINGVDANNARIIAGYLQGVWSNWLGQFATAQGKTLKMPVVLEQRVWFNPELRSRDFLVPGLIAVIMTLIGGLLTAMVVAREWERGTLEALMVTPVAVREILLGKLIPYFLLGMGGMALSVGMAVWLFRVPLQGSLWVLFGASALFLFAALGMGLLISTLAKNQFVAGQVAIIITFLPAFILSGFIFDIGSMPQPIQWITHLIAARYFVAILQTVFLAGNVWPVILVNALALLVMGTLFLALVRRRTRKRLE
jgi:ABC-2 type transport system permease protein